MSQSIQSVGANRTLVSFDDGREILVSYSTPVAGFFPGRGYLASSRKWSATTSKHVSQYLADLAGDKARRIDDAEFMSLVAPLNGGKR